MTMHHSQDAKKEPPLLYPIGGAWFRRERERIAIGRPVVAAHLGVPAGRLARIERKNELVPPEWWLLLPDLGFVNPWRSVSSQISSAVKEAPAPSPPLSAPRASAAKRAEVPLPAPSPARGLWLRGRRLDLGLTLQTTSKALGLTPHDLGVLEWQNLLVPPAWMSTLATFRFCRPVDPSGPSPLVSVYTGAWLRRERQRKGHTLESCAIPLGVRASFLGLVEDHDWPLTPEWIPLLAQLGFCDKVLAPTEIGRGEATDSKAAPPAATTVKPSPEQHHGTGAPMTRRAEGAAGPLASNLVSLEAEPLLSGPWLRTERQRLGLSQSDLKKALGVQLCTIQSAESRKTHVPKGWLSTLGSLGFRLPPQVANWNAAVIDELRLSGAWLVKARQRHMVSLAQVCKRLGVDASTLKKIEQYDRPLPVAWLSSLKQLGLRIPSRMLARSAIAEDTNPLAPRPLAHEPAAAGTASLVEQRRPEPLSFQHRQDLVEAAFGYRIRVGRSTGKQAFEVLVGLVEDVKQAGLEATLSYEVLDATLQALKRRARPD